MIYMHNSFTDNKTGLFGLLGHCFGLVSCKWVKNYLNHGPILQTVFFLMIQIIKKIVHDSFLNLTLTGRASVDFQW